MLITQLSENKSRRGDKKEVIMDALSGCCALQFGISFAKGCRPRRARGVRVVMTLYSKWFQERLCKYATVVWLFYYLICQRLCIKPLITKKSCLAASFHLQSMGRCQELHITIIPGETLTIKILSK